MPCAGVQRDTADLGRARLTERRKVEPGMSWSTVVV